MMRVLGIDPGTRKVGLAVVVEGSPLELEVAPRESAAARAGVLARLHRVEAVALGGQTGRVDLVDELREALPAALALTLVDERGSSYEARGLYWRLNPPRGLLRLVPRGMLLPPEPIDGYAAAVIACRFLEQRSRGEG